MLLSKHHLYITLLDVLFLLILISDSSGSRDFATINELQNIEGHRNKCEFEGNYYSVGVSPMKGKCSQVLCDGNCGCLKQKYGILRYFL